MSRVRPVLIVDDDPNDRTLLRLAFERAGVRHPLAMVHDGEEAMTYLTHHAQMHSLPCLLITDIKMPRVSGFDLLAWIRTQDSLSNLPIVVLSASCHERDMQRTLHMGAREYFIKPSDFQSLIKLVQGIEQNWLKPCCSDQTRAA